MKTIRALTIRTLALIVVCYPLLWAAAQAMGREPLSLGVVAAIAAISTVLVSDDLDDNE